MRVSRLRNRPWMPIIAAIGLLTSPGTTISAQTQLRPSNPAAQSKPATPVTSTATVNVGWPRNYKTTSGGEVVLYAPQVASWPDQRHMTAYSAVAYIAPGATKTALGTVKVEADTKVSLQERLVNFAPLKITESHFPSLPKEEINEIVAQITAAIPTEDRVIALDRVLSQVDASQIVAKEAKGISSDPPKIFFSKKAALLVNIDGVPVWSPIPENDLKFAVNTNWDLFWHGPTNIYYLRNVDSWLKASNVKGPWAAADVLPAGFNKLPDDPNFKDVKSNLAFRKLTPDKTPIVFVNLEPAEMILLQGEPAYSAVAGTRLLWVSNTESDVFRLGSTGAFYYLVTGRWFSAADLAGPWTFASTSLPEDFKKIPLAHPRSRVLASVPGTQQAAEAVLLAQIPQTARVNKRQVQAPTVTYQGTPEFKAIDTTIERAVNTDKDILKVGSAYYMCYQGVWFVAKGPTGPWEVTATVPPQIYEIPPSSPAHNVTYVTVKEDESDGDWVEVASYAGYTGMMIGWGCAVWGTGWYYPPYLWYGGYYPIYYPYWHTYGAAAWYNPYNGAFGVAGGIYGPYGGVTYGARYNPTTGTYARGAAAHGPYGSRGYAQAYNPRTGTYAQTRQGSGVYGSWGSTSVQRGDQWAQTKRYTDGQGQTTRVTRGDQGGAISRRGPDGSGFVGTRGDNVYAGRDGNVYKRDESGWHKFENGGWNSVRPDGSASQLDRTRPEQQGRDRQFDSSTHRQLERDHSSRSTGAQRSRDYGNYRSSGSSSRSVGSYGGYRGGGGGFRGGGGRR